MSSTKSIAKNSLFLYLRMFAGMIVGLFTAGIVLNTLGISDYGIYNIVGGFVSMFVFLNSSMSAATQRFLSFDLGKGNFFQLRKTFSTALTIHFGIALLIVIALETFGLWYINNQLNVPAERLPAVNVVFQFSVFTTFLGIIQVPYNALITAHERFNVYAYISFLEIGFKLLILFLIVHIHYDKLILYSGLLFCSSVIVQMIYRIYCRRNFPESRYHFYYNKDYFKTLISFTGWNLFGEVSAVARGQGNNLLLNSFFGPAVNAAYGVTMMVQGVISSFVGSFQTAVNPQIVKSYASEDHQRTLFLMQESAKLSFFIMLAIAIPVLYNLNFILDVWVKKVPPHTEMFIVLSVIGVLIDTISNPLIMGAKATGNIKMYQLVIGTLITLSLPLSYIGLKLGGDPSIIFAIIIIINILSLCFRLYFLKNIMKMNPGGFIKNVLGRILLCSITIFVLNYFIFKNYGSANSFVSLITFGAVNFLSSVGIIFLLGINQAEKQFIRILITKRK